jgi:predicted GH43/DUF377 family glycosyl hydrolase
MNWVKKGLIYAAEGQWDWNKSHAQVPVADYIAAENLIRIYYSARNLANQSLTSYIEVDADNPSKILHVSDEPILTLGKPGTFDDCGIMPSWIIDEGDKRYLYYIGWNVRNTVPYHNAVGLAISTDGGRSFEKFSEGPLWDRDYKEPYFSAATCVLKEQDVWKVWYLSCTGYYLVNNKMEPRYHMKYAESSNGIDWDRKGIIAIDYKNDEEAGIVKASVIRLKDKYLMWYAYRNFQDYRTDTNNSYKIGYAESIDGIHWERKDNEAGITISPTGWDAEMLAYPHVIAVKEKLYLFYNGNGFGKSGFGYAEMSINEI